VVSVGRTLMILVIATVITTATQRKPQGTPRGQGRPETPPVVVCPRRALASLISSCSRWSCPAPSPNDSAPNIREGETFEGVLIELLLKEQAPDVCRPPGIRAGSLCVRRLYGARGRSDGDRVPCPRHLYMRSSVGRGGITHRLPEGHLDRFTTRSPQSTTHMSPDSIAPRP
jgi:hypothetical protein